MSERPDNLKWIISFELIVLIQIVLILVAVSSENYGLIYSIIIVSVLWAYFIFNRWNVDERTELAIDDASRSAIQLFLLIIVPAGIGLIVYSQFVTSFFWEIGATLIVVALVLFSLHVLLAVHYESTLR